MDKINRPSLYRRQAIILGYQREKADDDLQQVEVERQRIAALCPPPLELTINERKATVPSDARKRFQSRQAWWLSFSWASLVAITGLLILSFYFEQQLSDEFTFKGHYSVEIEVSKATTASDQINLEISVFGPSDHQAWFALLDSDRRLLGQVEPLSHETVEAAVSDYRLTLSHQAYLQSHWLALLICPRNQDLSYQSLLTKLGRIEVVESQRQIIGNCYGILSQRPSLH